MISQSKRTGLGRFYGELEGKEDPKAVETNNVDYSSESDIDAPFDVDDDHLLDNPLGEDVLPRDSSPKPSGPMELVFEYDDDEQDGANEEDMIPLASLLNGDGLLNSDKILRGGSSHTTRDLVVPKKEEDRTLDTVKVVSPGCYFKRVKEEMLPPSTEEAIPVTVPGASRTLFGTANTRVQVGGFEPSDRLVALSKKMKKNAKAAEVAEKAKKRLARI